MEKKNFTNPIIEITNVDLDDIIVCSRMFGDDTWAGNEDIEWPEE